MVEIKLAVPANAADLATLQREYMRELFDKPWCGTVERLRSDLEERRLSAALARVRSSEVSADGLESNLVGFVAWTDAYDMHHCVRGGEMIDLYVRRASRGVGRSAQLVAFACREIEKSAGVYLKGTAVASAAPLYNRVAWGWDCREMILGGRAFRTVAANAGASPRAIVRGLPKPEWNHEP